MRRQRGFTLLEMLLVLALIVALTSFAAPALFGTLDNQRLRRGADQIRANWVRTRARAMEKGQTFTFRYTPGTGNYTVESWLSDVDYLESSQLVSLGVDASGRTLTAEVAKVETLPQNVTFVSSETQADMRAEVLALGNPDQASQAQYTPHIFFYPDGTTSTAQLVLANQRSRMVTLTMRGLTGVVRVSDMQTLSAQ